MKGKKYKELNIEVFLNFGNKKSLKNVSIDFKS